MASREREPMWHSVWQIGQQDMKKFDLKSIMDAHDVFVHATCMIYSTSLYNRGVTDEFKIELTKHIALLLAAMSDPSMHMCRRAAERLRSTLQSTYHKEPIGNEVADLRRRILDQAETVYCITLSPQEQDLFEPKEHLLGAEVAAKLPEVAYDVLEAAKCLSLSRYTAAVFHLMRVMEIGVQRLGAKLGVDLAKEKNWQNILDEIAKALKPLSTRDANTKLFSAACNHLYSVKVAWRNEVMHPKQNYNADETEAIYWNVRAFMRDLGKLL